MIHYLVCVQADSGEDHMSAKTQIIRKEEVYLWTNTITKGVHFPGRSDSCCQLQAHPWDWEIYGDFHILQQNTAAESFCWFISFWHWPLDTAWSLLRHPSVVWRRKVRWEHFSPLVNPAGCQPADGSMRSYRSWLFLIIQLSAAGLSNTWWNIYVEMLIR